MSEISQEASPPQPNLPAHVRMELATIYRDLDAAVAKLEPACALSGRCCRFQEYGHTLFLSQAEAEFLITEALPTVRPLDDGSSCPWQDGQGRCTARQARPLGCRVYFCDPDYERHAPALSELTLGKIRELTSEHGLDWNYAPLHDHLRQAQLLGRLREGFIDETSPATKKVKPGSPSGPS